jgi:threonine synthase
MFADKEFSNDIKMSGVNSINWARIIAQSVYYFYSYFLVEDDNRPIIFQFQQEILEMYMLDI